MGAKEELLAAFRKTLEPLFQEFECKYRAGEKRPIIDAIAFSLQCDAKIPDWAKFAFTDAYFHNKPRSWDDAFGRPVPKGARIEGVRGRNKTEKRLFSRVRKLLDGGMGIDAALRQVSGAFGLSYSKARKIWYDPEARRDYALYRGAFYTARAMHDALGSDPDAEAIAVWYKENAELVREMMTPADELFPSSSKNK